MLGLLRFVGLLNAGIWLGGSVFLVIGALPAMSGSGMEHMLGTRHFPYYSGAIAHLVQGRFLGFHIACGIVALLHAMAQWLYSGKAPHRVWMFLLIGLLFAGVLDAAWIQGTIQQRRTAAYAVNLRPQDRETARVSLDKWQFSSNVLNLVFLCGIAGYFWRLATPLESTRFLTAAKFRS